MSFFLQVDVNSNLTPPEFRDRVIIPLDEALKEANLGRVLTGDSDIEFANGHYELAITVTDQERARALVTEVLTSIDQ